MGLSNLCQAKRISSETATCLTPKCTLLTCAILPIHLSTSWSDKELQSVCIAEKRGPIKRLQYIYQNVAKRNHTPGETDYQQKIDTLCYYMKKKPIKKQYIFTVWFQFYTHFYNIMLYYGILYLKRDSDMIKWSIKIISGLLDLFSSFYWLYFSTFAMTTYNF